MWGIVSFGGYLKLVCKLNSAWNFKGLGRLVGRLDRGNFVGERAERNVFLKVYVVDLKVFVDWIGYRKFSKTLRTYV